MISSFDDLGEGLTWYVGPVDATHRLDAWVRVGAITLAVNGA
jgi:hypothetical protein